MFKQNVVNKYYMFYFRDLTVIAFTAESLAAARLKLVANEWGSLNDVVKITERETADSEEVVVVERI